MLHLRLEDVLPECGGARDEFAVVICEAYEAARVGALRRSNPLSGLRPTDPESRGCSNLVWADGDAALRGDVADEAD